MKEYWSEDPDDTLCLPKTNTEPRTWPHSICHLSIECLLGTLLLEVVGEPWEEFNVSKVVTQKEKGKRTNLESGAIIAIDGKIVGEGC